MMLLDERPVGHHRRDRSTVGDTDASQGAAMLATSAPYSPQVTVLASNRVRSAIWSGTRATVSPNDLQRVAVAAAAAVTW